MSTSVTVVDVGSGDVVVVGDPVGGALAIGSSESELHADASSVRHAAKAAARRRAATADAPSTAKPRRPSDPQRLNPLAEKLRVRALVRNAEVLLAMSAPSISSSAKKHSDVRGGTLIAVGSHEPFIGDVTSNIRPHEQKSRTATRLNGFAAGNPWKRNSEGRTQPQRFPGNRRFSPVDRCERASRVFIERSGSRHGSDGTASADRQSGRGRYSASAAARCTRSCTEATSDPSTSDAVFGSIPRTSSSSWLVCHATGSERKVGDHRDLATVLVYRIAPRH